MNTAFQKTGRSRADLVRLLAAVPREERTLAAFTLGFVREREVEPKVQITIENDSSLVLNDELTLPSPEEPLPVAPIVQAPLWRFEGMVFHQEPGEVEPAREEVRGLTPEDLHGTGQSLFATPKASPLAPWSKLWPRLRQVLHSTTTSRDPDVEKWVRRVAQGEIMTRIPRLQRKAWPSRLSIWVDRSRRLIPIWADQMAVIRQLYQVCDRRNLNIRWIDARTRAKALGERGDFLQNIRLDRQTPVLELGDLGEFGTDAERHAWRKTAIRLRRHEVRLAALVPLGRSRSTSDLSRIWNAIPWEQGRVRLGYGLSKNTQTWPERAEQLLTMVSPAAYVQPGLLRALRLLLPPEQADVSTELDVWNHADVRGADASGMVLQAEAAEKWRNAFAADIDSTLQARVSETITHWHKGLPRELLRSETLVWLSVAPNVTAPGDVQDALDFAARLEGSAMASGDDPQWADVVKRFGHALLSGIPEAIYERIPALQTVWVAAFQGTPAPKSIDPAAIRSKLERPGETRHWYVRQVGARWVFGVNERGTEWPSYIQGPGSPLAWFEASRPWVTVVRGQTVEEFRLEPGLTLSFDLDEPVELRTDRCTVRLAPWVRESWTIAAGRDRYGLWADADIRGVVQRFRWIPPGRFLMGSPESEEGRYDDEGPQHWVTWTKGRWFGDTPVTQGLWKAVRQTNPSRFQSNFSSNDARPMEELNWLKCATFAEDIAMRMPSETEWEYACRAGTTTATWVGDLVIVGETNVPILDPIAWYAGNCGVNFELDDGYDTTQWHEKQYEFSFGGTKPVGLKAANPFGLFDMLGNVAEWCVDVEHPYVEFAATDPAPVTALNPTDMLIIRGGSWFSPIRRVRAARRGTQQSSMRWDYVGFRLARDANPDTAKKGNG